MKTIWIGKQYLLSRSARRTQSDARCKIPTGGVILRNTLVLFFTNLIDDLREIAMPALYLK